MNLLASLLCATTVAACTVALPPVSRANDGKSCADWATLYGKDRLVVIGSALEQKVGRPTDSKLAACLWSIVDQIADHTSEICSQRGGSYGDAVGVAFATAIDFCQTKISDAPNKPLQPTRAAQPNGQRESPVSGPRG